MRKEKTEHSARLPFAASMLIFGTIGLLRRFIDLPSGVIACFRGLLGCVLLLLLQRLGGKKPGLAAIRKSLLPLLISGGMIGFNWMLLFEAYRYTSIAVATLCYYTAPVMLILASPFVFHERLTWRQLVCVGLAACGMVLVSGVLDGGTLPDGSDGFTDFDGHCACRRLGGSICRHHRREPQGAHLAGRIRQDHRAAWRGGTGHGTVSGADGRLLRSASDGAVRRTDASGVADAYGDPLCDVFRGHGAPADANRRAHELS